MQKWVFRRADLHAGNFRHVQFSSKSEGCHLAQLQKIFACVSVSTHTHICINVYTLSLSLFIYVFVTFPVFCGGVAHSAIKHPRIRKGPQGCRLPLGAPSISKLQSLRQIGSTKARLSVQLRCWPWHTCFRRCCHHRLSAPASHVCVCAHVNVCMYIDVCICIYMFDLYEYVYMYNMCMSIRTQYARVDIDLYAWRRVVHMFILCAHTKPHMYICIRIDMYTDCQVLSPKVLTFPCGLLGYFTLGP